MSGSRLPKEARESLKSTLFGPLFGLFLACFWALLAPFRALDLPQAAFSGPPLRGGPEGAPRRGAPKGALFGPHFGLFSGPALPRPVLEGGGRGPSGLRPEGPERGPILAPFSAAFGLFSRPVLGPHFPPLFWALAPRAPKGPIFGPILAPFWPLFGLFLPLGRVLGFTARSVRGPFLGPSRLGPLFSALLGPVLGALWAPKPAPPGPLIFPLCFGLSASGRPKGGPKGAPFGPQKGPFGALFGPFWRVPAASLSFGGPNQWSVRGPPGPLRGPSQRGPGGAPGPGFGLFSASFPAGFGACFGPRFWLVSGLWGGVLGPKGALISASFWPLFSPLLGGFAAPKALVYQPVSAVLVGFRVKSPFGPPPGAQSGSKWVKWRFSGPRASGSLRLHLGIWESPSS